MHEAAAHLAGFTSDVPATVSIAPPEAGGHIGYRPDLLGFGFAQQKASLPVVLDALLRYADDPAAPTLYLGSTTIDTWLPGLREHNNLGFSALQPLASIWIGIPHSPSLRTKNCLEKFACVVARRCLLTLFF
ncbi:hypothetical protein BIFADO_01524, partial [Bifidobacterium adolescentis L2-32]